MFDLTSCAGCARPLRTLRRPLRSRDAHGAARRTRTRLRGSVRRSRAFKRELSRLLHDFAGRPTPLQFASRLTEQFGGPRIYIKREDLLHTGSHKINNCLGQGLLAVRMGKKRVIAETGAGQHGVATATVAALLGLSCTVYMGTDDMERQRLNVFRMRLLGAEVVGVDSGSRTLKDAINEAMRDWVTNVQTTHYLLGSVLGAHPYPQIVRDFHKIIGEEAREQILQRGRPPAGLSFRLRGRRLQRHRPVPRFSRRRRGENGRRGSGRTRKDARRARLPLAATEGFSGAKPGVLQGTYTYVLQTPDGQISTTHSVSAGLDYPAVGPEHAWLAELGRAEYTAISDEDAIEAARTLARKEGIIPALESAHALGELIRRAPKMKKNEIVILNLSGRGDKDMDFLSRYV